MKKYNRMTKLLWHFGILVLLFLMPYDIVSQRVIKRSDLLTLLHDNHPAIMAAHRRVDAAKIETRGAFSLPNPAVGIQSPTGSFYSLGINQNLDFPGVYSSRKKMLEVNAKLTDAQAQRDVRLLLYDISNYFHLSRHHLSRMLMLARQDSIMLALSQAAERRFKAGDIDYTESSFAALEYGQIHQEYVKAQTDYANSLRQLKTGLQLSDSVQVEPFDRSEWARSNINESVVVGNHPDNLVAQEYVNLISAQMRVEKNKAMPGVQLGYLNQAGKNTPIDMRWQVGLTIPLWFWQYSAAIKSNQARQEAAQAELSWTKSQLKTEAESALDETKTALEVVQWHIQFGLSEADKLENAANRFLEAGETNLVEHLRMMNDILRYRLQFTEAALSYFLADEKLKYYTNQTLN
jgi:cobalt-zinc-cadmium efflux system outer membrane protein